MSLSKKEKYLINKCKCIAKKCNQAKCVCMEVCDLLFILPANTVKSNEFKNVLKHQHRSFKV